MARMSPLTGRTALVTGAARGIGRACASRLIEHGATVVLFDIDEAAVNATAAELGGIAFAGDVRDQSALNAAAALAGPATLLVSNAGVLRDRSIGKLTDDEWSTVIDVHLTGAYRAVKAVWPAMSDAKRGSIVFTSSVARNGSFGQLNYSAAKAGLVAMARTIALEGARLGIRANAVAPGPITTELALSTPAEIRERWVEAIPLRRMGEPEDVAAAVAFLLSDDASFITGEVLTIDGGFNIKG